MNLLPSYSIDEMYLHKILLKMFVAVVTISDTTERFSLDLLKEGAYASLLLYKILAY